MLEGEEYALLVGGQGDHTGQHVLLLHEILLFHVAQPGHEGLPLEAVGPSEADLLEEVLLGGTGLDKVPPSAEVVAELHLLVAT